MLVTVSGLTHAFPYHAPLDKIPKHARDSAGTVGNLSCHSVNKHLKILALPRGLEPLFSP